MRLIDADALLERIAKRKQEVHDQSFAPNPYRDAYDCCRFDELNIVRNMTRNARTVDPVKHGRWIHVDELPSGDYFKCSECNRQIFLHFGWEVSAKSPADEYRYCSGCGAKMDGNQNGN